MKKSIVALFLAGCSQQATPAPHKVGSVQIAPTILVNNGSAQVDTTPGDLNNTIIANTVATSAGVVIDSGAAHSFVFSNVQNEGTLTGWWQLFCGQSTIDAGGVNDAGTVPTISLRCPAGTFCNVNEPQPCAGGGVWYSSSTQGILTVDAGVQNMNVHTAIR